MLRFAQHDIDEVARIATQSPSAEKDIFDKELRDAEVLAEREPYLAAEGLLKALNQEGLAREQSYNIVKVLLRQEHAFLRTFQEKRSPARSRSFGVSRDLSTPMW